MVSNYNYQVGNSFQVQRRYSEFDRLYKVLSPIYALIKNRKMPPKTSFPVKDCVTKQYRQSVFDELIKVIVQVASDRADVKQFLGIPTQLLHDAKAEEARRRLAEKKADLVQRDLLEANHAPAQWEAGAWTQREAAITAERAYQAQNTAAMSAAQAADRLREEERLQAAGAIDAAAAAATAEAMAQWREKEVHRLVMLDEEKRLAEERLEFEKHEVIRLAKEETKRRQEQRQREERERKEAERRARMQAYEDDLSGR